MTDAKLAERARIQHWTRQIIAANNCGKSKTEWCRENGIPKDQFYYWQRKIRTLALNHQLGDDIMCSAVIDTTAAEKEVRSGDSGSDDVAATVGYPSTTSETKTNLELSKVKSITSTIITEAEETDFYEIPFPSENISMSDDSVGSTKSDYNAKYISSGASRSNEKDQSMQLSPEMEIVHGDTTLRISSNTSPETLTMVMAVIRNA